MSFQLFPKVGRQKWEGLVPVYNIFIWLKIIKKPWWWGLILLIPGFSMLFMFASMNVSMGRMFDKFSIKDTLMQIFLPFIYFPMLASGKEELIYKGEETNWNNKEEIGKRKLSDQITLFLASFGVINVLVMVFKFTGSKEKLGHKSMIKEWGDSIVFALIAASLIRGYVIEAFTIPTPSMEKELLVGDFLFVNKLIYGSRVPFTPFAYPLVHNTIPTTYMKSYSELITLPYMRLPKFKDVERNEIVVFSYPTGDTAVLGRFPGSSGAGGEIQGHNYYKFIRDEAIQMANPKNNFQLTKFVENMEKYESRARRNILDNNMLYGFKTEGYATRPIDRKENYIKRCVAIPGDTLEIINGQLYIDSKENNVGENVNFKHLVLFSRLLNPSDQEYFKKTYGFNLGNYSDISIPTKNDLGRKPIPKEYLVNMSKTIKDKFVSDINSGNYGNLRIDTIFKLNRLKNNVIYSYKNIYPNYPSNKFKWTEDNYGPIWMPKEGETIKLTPNNWILYKRCISTYEGNKVSENNGVYTINGKQETEYTFKQNYYYMIGDNRHNSADSRMWGFVPADHIVGKGLIIWMSKDQERGWTDGGVRWDRIFKTF